MVVVVVVAAVVMVVVVRLLVLMLLMASSTLGSTEFLSCVRKGLVWLGSFLWSTKVDVVFVLFVFLSSALSFTLFLSLFRVMWLVPNPHSKETLHSFLKRKLNSVRFHPQVSSTLSFIYFFF